MLVNQHKSPTIPTLLALAQRSSGPGNGQSYLFWRSATNVIAGGERTFQGQHGKDILTD